MDFQIAVIGNNGGRIETPWQEVKGDVPPEGLYFDVDDPHSPAYGQLEVLAQSDTYSHVLQVVTKQGIQYVAIRHRH